MSWRGLHTVGTTPRQQGKNKTDDVVSLMVRARDAELACILAFHNHCNPRNEMECGHFIERRFEATRYHPWNVNKECHGCNNSHVSGMKPDKGFPYGIAIDAKYGEGTARFLYDLAHPKKELNAPQFQEGWSADELTTLRDAARRGARVYEAIYFELRPHHRLINHTK